MTRPWYPSGVGTCPDITLLRYLALGGYLLGLAVFAVTMWLWDRSDRRRDLEELGLRNRLDFYKDMASFNGIHTQKTRLFKP